MFLLISFYRDQFADSDAGYYPPRGPFCERFTDRLWEYTICSGRDRLPLGGLGDSDLSYAVDCAHW